MKKISRRDALGAMAGALAVVPVASALEATNQAVKEKAGFKTHDPTGRLIFTAEQLLKRPRVAGIDPTVFYFHFRPGRPADIVVTHDAKTGDLDFTPQTFGPLTDHPLTLCLHTNRSASPHSTRNLGQVGAEAVVALPGPELVHQTWAVAVPMPRGINEGEAAGLTLLPSRLVKVPGIAQCPVNLECRVELVREHYSHNAVFLKVLGATVDEELLRSDRLAVIRRGPTYEVDDAKNRWGGAIERLGTNHDLLECPGFPVCAKAGPEADAAAWMGDLRQAGYLSEPELKAISSWLEAWEKLVAAPPSAARTAQQLRLSRVFELAAWEQWNDLHAHLGKETGA